MSGSVAPLPKDLVTDVAWNYRAKKAIKPFRPRAPEADGTWRMAQADVERVQEFRKCIECFLCQDVCHLLREHRLFEPVVGPLKERVIDRLYDPVAKLPRVLRG